MFFHPNTWQLSTQAADGAIRIPVTVALVLGALMGALFVLFLPVVGFVLVGKHVWTERKRWSRYCLQAVKSVGNSAL
jgi:hypothetical protein